jgi:hypothetical protein
VGRKKGDADKRRFSIFFQDQNVFRRLSEQICGSLNKKDSYNFLSNKKGTKNGADKNNPNAGN